MKFPGLDRKYSGISLPLSSLKSDESCGCGEFPDLVPMAEFCRSAGLEIIQILPVNDSGESSSPYSALSAFALHPVYLRISRLRELKESPGKNEYLTRLQGIREKYEAEKRIPFAALIEEKLDLLYSIFTGSIDSIRENEELFQWIRENRWLGEYAVFRSIKRREKLKAWYDWSEFQRPSREEIDSRFRDELQKGFKGDFLVLFFSWLQFRLEQQLCEAAEKIGAMGVYLKGDLPILMNPDSVENWAHPEIFRQDLLAGAPPDMFSDLGQNWGFPIYDWKAQEGDDFRWWKDRLHQADKFYYAYRIDHVLGFFRIWANPVHNSSGILGYFFPSVRISRQRLREEGFPDHRIKWLSEPHIREEELWHLLGEREKDIIAKIFKRIGNEDLFVFSEAVRGERDIETLELPEEVRGELLARYRDRALLEVEEDLFDFAWHYPGSTSYLSLHDDEKSRFQALAAENKRKAEELWEKNGRKLLSFMNSTAEMLTCAEDLGVIPECVPRVLEELSILGLRIPRWTRYYGEGEEDFIHPSDYPVLSVCAPSVHDTSTMRGFWEKEADREKMWSDYRLKGPPPDQYDEETAEKVLKVFFDSKSVFCIPQMQDLLDLDPELRSIDPASDRVNIPGTYNGFNWGYRIPVKLKELLDRTALLEKIRRLNQERNRRLETKTVSRNE